ncbi:unnamed protein product, partial [Symbiodinium sp. KB8]
AAITRAFYLHGHPRESGELHHSVLCLVELWPMACSDAFCGIAAEGFAFGCCSSRFAALRSLPTESVGDGALLPFAGSLLEGCSARLARLQRGPSLLRGGLPLAAVADHPACDAS